jgi:hypothetical protein
LLVAPPAPTVVVPPEPGLPPLSDGGLVVPPDPPPLLELPQPEAASAIEANTVKMAIDFMDMVPPKTEMSRPVSGREVLESVQGK